MGVKFQEPEGEIEIMPALLFYLCGISICIFRKLFIVKKGFARLMSKVVLSRSNMYLLVFQARQLYVCKRSSR